MKHFKLKYLLGTSLLLSILSSCTKDPIDPVIPEIKAERKGLFVLSEGLFNANNTSLTYYDYDAKTLVADQFRAINNRGLGDTGNDIKVYDGKMYVVMNVSNTLEIMDAKTAKAIKTISFLDNGKPRQPRYIVFNKTKGFISSYDGTVAVLDLATQTIEKYISVGRNPEQMAVSNNKLYVANSGGLDYPNYDKTVSVIDLNTLTEIKKITVTENPHGVVADGFGDVYVMSTGNYSTVKANMAVINSQTDEIKVKADFSGGAMVISGDYGYVTGSGGIVRVLNVRNDVMTNGLFTMEKQNFISDGTKITTAYGIAYDSVNQELFVTDAKNYTTNGEVVCFDKDGKKKYSLTTGINPNNVVFIDK